MRTQPNLGLRRFISMMAAMSSAEGPLGPGLRRCAEEEKSRRYLRSTRTLWNLKSVAGLTSAPTFAIRRGLTNSVLRPSTKRSSVVRFGVRCPGSITDQKLMLEQKRLCCDGAYTTWADQLREGDQQV